MPISIVWSFQLQEYTFDIKYTPGKSNCVADWLSQFPVDPSKDIAAISSSFDATLIRAAQSADAIIRPISDNLSANRSIKYFCFQDGPVCRIVQRHSLPTLKLPFVPMSVVPALLATCHDHPLSGHMGLAKTWLEIKDRFYWPNMYRTVKNDIAACRPCQTCKVSRQKASGLLQPIEPPSSVFDLLGLEFLGIIPPPHVPSTN